MWRFTSEKIIYYCRHLRFLKRGQTWQTNRNNTKFISPTGAIRGNYDHEIDKYRVFFRYFYIFHSLSISYINRCEKMNKTYLSSFRWIGILAFYDSSALPGIYRNTVFSVVLRLTRTVVNVNKFLKLSKQDNKKWIWENVVLLILILINALYISMKYQISDYKIGLSCCWKIETR
jgi:hypothetical protein